MSDVPEIATSKEIFEGRVFKVRIDGLWDGQKRWTVDIVEHPGSLAIAATPTAESIILVRQYRHAAGAALWEIPAGSAEPGEPGEIGARRELQEETGYTADDLELVCSVYPTPGYCTERLALFVARGLHAGPQQLEEDERIEVRAVSLKEARRMQAHGEIVDMKTVLALLWLTSA